MLGMYRLLVLLVLAVMAAAIAGWLSLLQPGGSGPILAIGQPRSLDPAQASRLDEFRLLDGLFDPLVRLDSATLAVRPALADHWRHSVDGKQWIFHISTLARWSDGRPVVAEDMRRGLLRHLVQHSPTAYLLEAGLAGTPLASGGNHPTSEELAAVGLDCPDPHTLVVRLRHPVPYLPYLLSLPVFVPATLAQAGMRADGSALPDNLEQRSALWDDPVALIGNGPLRCTSYAPRSHADFAPAATYGGPWRARGRLRVVMLDAPATALRLYLTGQIDAITGVPAHEAWQLAQAHAPGLTTAASFSTAFLRLRMIPAPGGDHGSGGSGTSASSPLADAALRQALAQTIDRSALVDGLLDGHATASTTLVPDCLRHYLPYPELAGSAGDGRVTAGTSGPTRQSGGQRAAAAVGWPRLTILVPSQPVDRLSIAELIADGWRRRLGLDVTIDAVPSTALRTRESAGTYQISMALWLGDYLDPTSFLDCFRSQAGANRTGYTDAIYDALLDHADSAPPEDRWQELAAAERRVLAAHAIIPLYQTECCFLARPGLTGMVANPLEIIHLADVGWSAPGPARGR